MLYGDLFCDVSSGSAALIYLLSFDFPRNCFGLFVLYPPPFLQLEPGKKHGWDTVINVSICFLAQIVTLALTRLVKRDSIDSDNML